MMEFEAEISSFIFSFNSEELHRDLDYQIPDEGNKKGMEPM